jgi:hypothetical protein
MDSFNKNILESKISKRSLIQDHFQIAFFLFNQIGQTSSYLDNQQSDR